MLSRLQELRKEEETLLRVKAALHEQLTRLKVGGTGRAGADPRERSGAGRPLPRGGAPGCAALCRGRLTAALLPLRRGVTRGRRAPEAVHLSVSGPR